jgi:hypothetical protein
MSKATNRKTAAISTGQDSEEFAAASFGLPPELKAKVKTAAKDNDRPFAAQLRVIVKEWAAKQSAT